MIIDEKWVRKVGLLTRNFDCRAPCQKSECCLLELPAGDEFQAGLLSS